MTTLGFVQAFLNHRFATLKMRRYMAIALTFCALGSVRAASHQPIEPSHDAAKDNAHHIFNAIHSAGRQWGSSVYHNGFSFFPAIMPKGTLTYHGGRSPDPPTNPEWLAFEVEHAENFALSWRHRPRGPLDLPTTNDEYDHKQVRRGYWHTYRANRDLNLLYIDGMSAGKTKMGTLDSQDLLMRENNTKGDDWGYDGIMRDELGFEVIYCDFNDGLDFVSATRTFFAEDKVGTPGDIRAFQWARAAAERYEGIGGDRVRIDFSSMVSGFFFPINVSSINPDRPDLLRLAAAPLSDLKDIKAYLCDVATQPRRFNINWQALVDMIVTRFADRFAVMGSRDVLAIHFIDELEAATLLYVNAPPSPEDETDLSSTDHERSNKTEKAVDRCSEHYLLPALIQRDVWKPEDELIYTAVSTVARDICSDLFTMRAFFLELETNEVAPYKVNKGLARDDLELASNMSKFLMHSMVDRLGWTILKTVRRCPVDEVPFVAMWPFGSEKDHWSPGCRSFEEMRDIGFGYWTERDLHPKPDALLVNDEL